MGVLRTVANVGSSFISKRSYAQKILGRIRYLELLLADKIDDQLPNLPVEINKSLTENRNDNQRLRLHFIGNSHAHSFTSSDLSEYGIGNQTKFLWDSISLGPLSSKDLVEKKWALFLKLIEKSLIESGDTLVFPFGEAECRWYALKSIEPEIRNFLTEQDIPLLLDPYLDASFEVYKKVVGLGFKVILWSGHASRGISPREDPDIPVSSNADFRIKMCEYWRVRTRQFSESNNYPFFDFLSVMQVNKGLEVEKFLVDDVHLNSDITSGFILANIVDLKI